jgi:RNA polymerase sigma-70 factor (ECF subfamily)
MSTLAMAEPVQPDDRTERGHLESPELAAIYEEHARSIYYLALRYLGNPAQAEDATHDVFLKAFRKLHDFRGQSSIRTWLYRITINHCQSLLQSWHQRHIQTPGNEELWDNAQSTGDSPLRVLETAELGQRIQSALDALPEEYRLLLLLVADEQLSYEEIASLTQQSSDAVRGKLHRARKAFIQLFNKTA